MDLHQIRSVTVNNRTERQTISPWTRHVKHIHVVVALRLLSTPKKKGPCPGKRSFCTLLLVFHIKPLAYCKLPADVCGKTKLRHAKVLFSLSCSFAVQEHRTSLSHVNEQWPVRNEKPAIETDNFLTDVTEICIQRWIPAHTENTSSPSGSQGGCCLTSLALHEARRARTKRTFRTLSLSCIFVVGSLQVRSWHSCARWQNLNVTEGSKQLWKSFRIRNHDVVGSFPGNNNDKPGQTCKELTPPVIMDSILNRSSRWKQVLEEIVEQGEVNGRAWKRF